MTEDKFQHKSEQPFEIQGISTVEDAFDSSKVEKIILHSERAPQQKISIKTQENKMKDKGTYGAIQRTAPVKEAMDLEEILERYPVIRKLSKALENKDSVEVEGTIGILDNSKDEEVDSDEKYMFIQRSHLESLKIIDPEVLSEQSEKETIL